MALLELCILIDIVSHDQQIESMASFDGLFSLPAARVMRQDNSDDDHLLFVIIYIMRS
jgi:hypothetical protein